jgi:signal transduction histidine kinase
MNYKKSTALVIAVIFMCLAGPVVAQFEVRNFSVAEGLPSTETYYVFQDNQRFIWIATDHGVAKFDGYEMTVFRATDGLEDPVVFGISQDHRGRIWFRTYSGRLFFYEDGKIHPYQYNDILANACSKKIMSSIYVDSKDQLWFFIAGDNWGKIDDKGYLTMDTTTEEAAIVFKTIEKGHLSGYSGSRLGKDLRFTIDGKHFNGGKFMTSVTPTQCYTFWRGLLYLSFDKMIFRFDGEQLHKIFTAKETIISMSLDSDDGLWLGYHSGGGAERYKDTTFKNPWQPDFLTGKSVSRVFSDKEKGLWMTTLERGVFFLPNPSIELFKFKRSSKVAQVTYTDSEVIFGTYDRMITVMDAQKVIPIEEGKHSTDKWAMDSGGNIWTKFDRPFSSSYLAKRTKYLGSKVVDFTEDKEGYLWVLTNQGLYKHDQNGNVLQRKVHHSRARSMLVENSKIYLVDRLGLQVFDTDMHLLEAPVSLSKFRISGITRLGDSLLFIATVGNGFLLANENNWSYKKFDGKSGFIADNVYASHIRDSALWMGTENGVFIISVESILKNDPAYVQLAKSSGLIADRVNFLAFTKKTAWAFSDEGISMIPYDLVQQEDNRDLLYLKHLMVNNKRIQFADHITLPYDSANLSLTYGFLSLKNQNFICRYRLTISDPWVYTKARSLQFYSLAPDQYHLELEYSVDNFHWKSSGTALSFVVLAPWWQKWYFQISVLMVIAGMIFLYLRNHFRMLHRHRQKLVQTEIETLERERSRIAKELHDGVATNLGAIKLMANYTLRKHDELAARDVDEYFVSTINEIKGVIYGLTPPELKRDGLFICLKNYVEKLNKSLPVKVYLTAQGEKRNQPEFDLTCFRIIQELLANSAKHAFSKNVVLQIEANHNFLRILFKDDGVGFVPQSSGAPGLGLTHIDARVRSMNGDLEMETGKDGTQYIIVIPLVMN